MIHFRMGEGRSRRLAFFFPPWLALVMGLVSLAAVQGQAQSSESSDSATEVIHGTVINSATQAPIPRALVQSPDGRYATLTDSDGHFEFDMPKQPSDAGVGFTYSGSAPNAWVSGNHIPFPLIARKPGFLDLPDQVGGPVFTADNDLAISLVPEGIIKGHVTSAGDDAAGGIIVQLFSRVVDQGVARWVPGATAQANSEGEFRFAELQPGSYKIATHEWMDNDQLAVPGAQVYGYPPLYYPGVGDFASAGAIELSAGQTVEANLSITRQPYFRVRIPVANGDLSNGLNISVQGQQGSRYELGYNPEEQRIEGMLPSGNYVVRASSFGPNSVSGSVSIRVADGALQGPSMALTPNSAIPVNVKEEFSDKNWNGSGQWGPFRIRGARVYLQANLESADDFEQGGGGLKPPTAPNDDNLFLDPVPPGRYRLRISSSRGYIASATMGSTDLLQQAVTLGGGTSAPIEITVRDDGAELEGSISSLAQQNNTSASQGPRAWVYCVPLPESTGQFQEAGVSEEGKFDLQMMAPGDYRIFAFNRQQPRLPYRDAEAMKGYETSGQVVHLSAGEKTSVQVELASPPE
jgi:hypothetical protein